MSEWSDKVLCLACDSHQPVSQASIFQTKGPERLSDLHQVTEQKVAELGQHCHSLPFSAHIFPSPDPSSLPHPLSCPSPTSLCQPPGVPSTHLSCSVKSLLPPPLGCLVKKMVGAVVCTAGPDSKAPHLRHQLPGTYSELLTTCGTSHSACTGVPSFILPTLHSAAPACLPLF